MRWDNAPEYFRSDTGYVIGETTGGYTLSTAKRSHTLRKMLIAAIAAMMLTMGLAPAAYAHDGKRKARGGDGGEGGIGIGIGLCVIAKCDNVGSGNGAGGDGGPAKVKGH